MQGQGSLGLGAVLGTKLLHKCSIRGTKGEGAIQAIKLKNILVDKDVEWATGSALGILCVLGKKPQNLPRYTVLFNAVPPQGAPLARNCKQNKFSCSCTYKLLVINSNYCTIIFLELFQGSL